MHCTWKCFHLSQGHEGFNISQPSHDKPLTGIDALNVSNLGVKREGSDNYWLGRGLVLVNLVVIKKEPEG